MTYGELLELGRRHLRDAGIADADTDAGMLLEYLTGLTRSELTLRQRDEIVSAGGMPSGTLRGLGSEENIHTGVDGSLDERYLHMIERRVEHVPVQYITGEADFMGLRFEVSPDVLIPRFDTEFLVEEMMKEVGDGSSVLDMCTGSGCIILSLMRYKNDLSGVGVDISRAALDIARENEKLIFNTQASKSTDENGLYNIEFVLSKRHEPVDWILSDMFDEVSGKFDYIVSNPPYIKSDVIDGLMPEVREHEPRIALDGDADGLKFYRIIARDARKHLRRHGKLFLEIGYDEGEAVAALLDEHGYKNVQIKKDYAGNNRVVICNI